MGAQPWAPTVSDLVKRSLTLPHSFYSCSGPGHGPQPLLLGVERAEPMMGEPGFIWKEPLGTFLRRGAVGREKVPLALRDGGDPVEPSWLPLLGSPACLGGGALGINGRCTSVTKARLTHHCFNPPAGLQAGTS